MIDLVSKLPKYWVQRKFNANVSFPINYTLSLTYRCQARCASCRIYDKPQIDELTIYEWHKIFKSIGKTPYWCTLSGGEPFLYKDIVELYYLLNKECSPTIINIPTNGQLTDLIVDKVWQMAKMFPTKKLNINVSLDHYDKDKNDEIRGVKGYWDKAINTVQKLQDLKLDNLNIGIHTVISKFNVKDIGMIAMQLSSILDKPEHFITEIAEQRVELGTIGLDITPEYEDYKQAIKVLKQAYGVSANSIIKSFRMDYYDKVVKWFNGYAIPCYAGYASCHISPDGDIWYCCIKAKSIGNLRKSEYDFKSLWNGDIAQLYRMNVKNCVLGCPLANANYTNSLFHVPTLIKVAKGLL